MSAAVICDECEKAIPVDAPTAHFWSLEHHGYANYGSTVIPRDELHFCSVSCCVVYLTKPGGTPT